MPSDEGIKRDEHKIIYEYLIGQPTRHTPKWTGNRGPPGAFKTRVNLIRNAAKMGQRSEKLKNIKLESEAKIKQYIAEKIRDSFSPNRIQPEYYWLKASEMQTIQIELELFPDVWELEQPNQKESLLFNEMIFPSIKAELKGKHKTQTNIVFCNPIGKDYPFIAEPEVLSDRTMYINDKIKLEEKRVTYDKQNWVKPHAKNPQYGDWRTKPRFANERSNFVPISFFDVYSPDIKNFTPKKLIMFWENKKVIRPEDSENKAVFEEEARLILDSPDSLKDNLKLFEIIKDHLEKSKITVDAQSLMQATKEFFLLSVEDGEKIKLDILKLVSQKASVGNKLFDIYYCDKFEVVNFTVGYFSGKFEGESKDPPRLRKFSFECKEYDHTVIERKEDQPIPATGNITWPVFFQTFETEGLLFIPTDELLNSLKRDAEKLFGVSHTIAHAIMRNVPKFSGIDHGLIREYLFEQTGAFIIYSREPGEFRTKGLKFLFENNLENLFSEIETTLDCPFQIMDSLDQPHKIGCGNCSMLPIGCTIYNQKLDRYGALDVIKTLYK